MKTSQKVLMHRTVLPSTPTRAREGSQCKTVMSTLFLFPGTSVGTQSHSSHYSVQDIPVIILDAHFNPGFPFLLSLLSPYR